jgi:hypothetical protein
MPVLNKNIPERLDQFSGFAATVIAIYGSWQSAAPLMACKAWNEVQIVVEGDSAKCNKG